MSQNASYALNYFVQQGWTPQQAAGIVGNLMQESGPNLNLTGGDGGVSQGIAQWNGKRLSALQQYADQQGGNWKNLDTQLGFIQNELGGSESKAGQDLRAAQTIPDATAAFTGFERPQGWTPDNPQGANAYDKRLQYAMQSLGGNSAAMGIDSPQQGVTTTAQSLVNPPMASAAMVKPTTPDAFSQLQNAQPSALNQLFGAQQPLQAQSQQPEISDQDVAAELQRRGIGAQQQTMPDLSDDQIKQELQRRGLGKPPDLYHATPEQRQAYVNSIASTPQQHSDAYNMTLRPLKAIAAYAAGAPIDTPMALGQFVGTLGGLVPTPPGVSQPPAYPVGSAIMNYLNKAIPTDEPTTMGGFVGQEAAKQAGNIGGYAAFDNAVSKFANAPEKQISTSPAVAPDQSPAVIENNSTIPMSAGQKTQNPDLQRAEADIVAGAKGSKAQAVANDFRAMQNEAMQEHIASLGAAKEGANPADNIGTISKVIQSNAGLANEDVNAAYGKARELAASNPNTASGDIVLAPKDIKNNLVPAVKDLAKEYTIKPNTTPKAFAQLQELNDFAKQSGKKWVNLTDLEAWRRATSRLSRNATDPADGLALRQLVGTYDDYMGSAADRMTGQTGEAINAFKDAVSSRAAYGKQFQGNDLVESIVEGKTSVDDLTKQLLGTGSVGGKQGMLDNYRAIVKAAGDKAPVVQKQLQDAFAQKIYETASKGAGKLANSETQAISPARMKTALEGLFVNQRDLATELYGQDAVDKASSVIKALGQITSKQSNVGNVSSSGYTAMRLAKANAATLLSHIPGFRILGSLAKVAGEQIENQRAAEDATKLFMGQVPKRFIKGVR